ncbi:MAG TPA: class I SAM-dependent methyltransferase, partial [Thermoanaerobaculia bacterium]|nr:class I SAM-dependent methyltransferase [Thermoanaerobaculia bacterium]
MTATATSGTAGHLDAIKAQQQATWKSGDYSAVATLIVPVAEKLVDFADLRAGSEVLDVATGSGNAALAAARLQARVAGIDYVAELLERGRERAAAERLTIDLREGDAEHLPYADASFDAVVSVFGSMFAPDHQRTASEMLRVTRPGGTVALASWTPDGFLGDLFRTVGQFAPPPPGIKSPMLWGTAEHLESIFGSRVEWTHTTAWFTFRFPSAEAFVDYFADKYGPTLKALAASGDHANELRSAFA